MSLSKERNAERMRKQREGARVYSPNGGYIHIEKLVDAKWRALISYLVENLNPSYQHSLRIGVNGVTVEESKSLLEATPR